MIYLNVVTLTLIRPGGGGGGGGGAPHGLSKCSNLNPNQTGGGEGGGGIHPPPLDVSDDNSVG